MGVDSNIILEECQPQFVGVRLKVDFLRQSFLIDQLIFK